MGKQVILRKRDNQPELFVGDSEGSVVVPLTYTQVWHLCKTGFDMLDFPWTKPELGYPRD